MSRVAFSVLLLILALAYRLTCTPEAGVDSDGQAPTGTATQEAFTGFREAVAADRLEDLERWALEIDRRRLLEGLSADEIRQALGEPTGKRWVYLDQEVLESRNPLKRWTSKRGDYWSYSTYQSDPYMTVAFCLAFDGTRLAWTSYQRYTPEELIKHVKTYYEYAPAKRSRGSGGRDGNGG